MEKDKNRRLIRVSKNIKTALSELLIKDTKNPEIFNIQLNDVEVSPDLRHAKVFFSMYGDGDVENIEKALKKAAPFFQRRLASVLSLKNTPLISFYFDDTAEKGARIDAILKETANDLSASLQNMTNEQRLSHEVANANIILLSCHAKPDGDAVGSLLGLNRVFEMQGKKTVMYCPDQIPDYLSFLEGSDRVVTELSEDFAPDIAIILDTASNAQFPEGFPIDDTWPLFVLDHHSSFEEFGDFVIRRDVSATGELLTDLCSELLWPLDKLAADALYVAIVTDTGSFRQENATSSAHRAAAKLIDKGVRPSIISSKIYGAFAKERQLLFGKVASTLEFKFNGRLAVMFCTAQMIKDCGATLNHLEGMINFARDTEGVQIAAMFVERGEGKIKAGLRSIADIDVSSLAAIHGGGGHKNASGCTLTTKTIEEAIKLLSVDAENFLI